MFITFEGIDGSGKSTQIKLLASWLRTKGKEVVVLREPGGTALSEAVRTVLLSVKNDIHPRAELLLFEAARAQLAETVIRPALRNGSIVISDRFADSSTAYQGYGRGLPTKAVAQCNAFATDNLTPDISFLLDISVDLAFSRSLKRNVSQPDRMEQAGRDFFEQVRQGYLLIAQSEPKRFYILSANLSLEEIHKSICEIISTRLFGHNISQ